LRTCSHEITGIWGKYKVHDHAKKRNDKRKIVPVDFYITTYSLGVSCAGVKENNNPNVIIFYERSCKMTDCVKEM
jgi:hypothetical protein